MAFVDDVLSSGALPSLALTMRFAARRQVLLAHNIANLDTPGFQPRNVSPAQFQKLLGEAIDRRRSATGGAHGRLDWRPTREILRGPNGSLRLEPRTPSGNILFHDRNNRDLERLMQDLAENVAAFRLASDLMRNRVANLRAAIAERV